MHKFSIKPLTTALAAVALTALLTNHGATAQQVGSTEAFAPELGNFGIDLSARNESVKPGDDFFAYASGTWYDNFEIPADKGRYGPFNKLNDRSRQRVQAIVDELALAGGAPGSNEQMVADFYRAFMDVETINNLGLEPLREELESIAAISDKRELTWMMGSAWQNGVSSPITGSLGTNRTNPDRYQFTVSTGGLGLPDRDYYLEDTERFEEIRAAYRADIEAMLVFAGLEDAAERAERVLALETRMAGYLWTRAMRRNRDLTLNQMSREELEQQYPGFDWDVFLDAAGYKARNLNVVTPDALQQATALIANVDLDDWKSYLTYHLVANHAAYLSEDIYNKHFELTGRTLAGQQEPEPRWKRAITAMSGTRSLGFAIGEIYVQRHFPERSKEQMSELVENLRTALGERIENLTWMGDETRTNALAKLNTFRPKIGYPDVWPSMDGVVIEADDLVGNLMRLRAHYHADDVTREEQKTDRERWSMAPQRVNAYYNSSFNEIVFPAGILQPPFFDPNADPAVNYGAIGAVIGHEMGHGFDDQGSKSDAYGIQKNWWTDADRAAFEERTAMLVEQYSAYEPIPGNFVNGANALGENIGDVGGLAMAYHAYRLSLKGKEAPIIGGLTGDQRFFLSWAQVWREKRTEASMLSQLRGGTHTPGRYRALAPRNHDAWYAAFDVKPGDALYLPPEKRVRIW